MISLTGRERNNLLGKHPPVDSRFDDIVEERRGNVFRLCARGFESVEVAIDPSGRHLARKITRYKDRNQVYVTQLRSDYVFTHSLADGVSNLVIQPIFPVNSLENNIKFIIQGYSGLFLKAVLDVSWIGSEQIGPELILDLNGTKIRNGLKQYPFVSFNGQQADFARVGRNDLEDPTVDIKAQSPVDLVYQDRRSPYMRFQQPSMESVARTLAQIADPGVDWVELIKPMSKATSLQVGSKVR